MVSDEIRENEITERLIYLNSKDKTTEISKEIKELVEELLKLRVKLLGEYFDQKDRMSISSEDFWAI